MLPASKIMYTKAKKILGYWTVQLASNGVTQFKSLSRASARAWYKANEPRQNTVALNEMAGRSIWRQRKE